MTTTSASASVSRNFEYQDQMMRSELYVRASATLKSKTAELGEVKLADGIIVTPLLVEKNPKVITFSDNYKQIVPEAYQADITYGTNNEFGFDYLRDNMVQNPNEIVQGNKRP